MTEEKLIRKNAQGEGLTIEFKLAKNDLLQRIGDDKSGYWKLINKVVENN